MASLLLLLPGIGGGAFSCGECLTLQEGIQKSIVHNISDLEAKAQVGSANTATVEIGQIIWSVCDSDAWKSLRYNSALTDACKENSKQHVDMMTNLWKDKTSDDYKDPAIALRMKRAICPHQDIGACDLKVLPSDYEPLRPDECQVCRALVSDLFGIVRRSRDRPKSAKSDAYFRLISAMGSVCTELPMRHAMRSTSDREKVTELCEDIWDEHESSLSRIALRRSAEYAQALCSEELEVCDEPLSMAELFSHDPGASSADEAKDEL